jgi:hypothetical protein
MMKALKKSGIEGKYFNIIEAMFDNSKFILAFDWCLGHVSHRTLCKGELSALMKHWSWNSRERSNKYVNTRVYIHSLSKRNGRMHHQLSKSIPFSAHYLQEA